MKNIIKYINKMTNEEILEQEYIAGISKNEIETIASVIEIKQEEIIRAEQNAYQNFNNDEHSLENQNEEVRYEYVYFKSLSALEIEKYEKAKIVQELNNELSQIKDWLNCNDYIVNKVVLGEWQADDARFINYKIERMEKRRRIDELQLLIDNHQLGG